MLPLRSRMLLIILVLLIIMAFANAHPDSPESYDDVDWSLFLKDVGEQFEAYANNEMASMTTSPMRSNGATAWSANANANEDQSYPSPLAQDVAMTSPYRQQLPYNTANSPQRSWASVALTAMQNIRAAQPSHNLYVQQVQHTAQGLQVQTMHAIPPAGRQEQQQEQRRHTMYNAGLVPQSQSDRAAQIQQQYARQQQLQQQLQLQPHQQYDPALYAQQQFVQQQIQQQAQPPSQPQATQRASSNHAPTYAQVVSSPPQRSANIGALYRTQLPYQPPQIRAAYQSGAQPNQGSQLRPTPNSQPPQNAPVNQPAPNIAAQNLNFQKGMNEGVLPVEQWAAQRRAPLAPQDQPIPFVDTNQSNRGQHPSVQSPTSTSVISSRLSGRRTKEELTSGTSAYTCHVPGCGHGFDTNSDLGHHLRYHTPFEQRPWACKACTYRSVHKKDRDRHYESIHNGGATRFHCYYAGCSYRAKRPDHVKRHFNSQHPDWEYCKDSVQQSSQSSSSRNVL